ncbi:MAG: NADH:ubiquinone oxidoreductase subunit J [Betaproteobacteria bacterium RIFCSPLOWO2_12_FULL_62_58]|nr:MAG: NADH:ubiquinone oxidoreductase subunit J [Betaproteobacteria bacterium RIFCSPLOWO2_12_FULL_62_58]
MFEIALFYAFAAVLVVSAIAIITARNPVHAVLCMVQCFFTTAALWLLLRAEFLAIVLVLVYVGAVMVLFLFVVMTLDVNIERLREDIWKNLPLALAVGGVMVLEMVAVLANRYFGASPAALPPGYSNTKALGRLLYTQYVYAFEIAGVILLAAIVAAIALTLRRRKDRRRQDPSEQVRVRREQRVRLVSMTAEGDE